MTRYFIAISDHFDDGDRYTQEDVDYDSDRARDRAIDEKGLIYVTHELFYDCIDADGDRYTADVAFCLDGSLYQAVRDTNEAFDVISHELCGGYDDDAIAEIASGLTVTVNDGDGDVMLVCIDERTVLEASDRYDRGIL